MPLLAFTDAWPLTFVSTDSSTGCVATATPGAVPARPGRARAAMGGRGAGALSVSDALRAAREEAAAELPRAMRRSLLGDLDAAGGTAKRSKGGEERRSRRGDAWAAAAAPAPRTPQAALLAAAGEASPPSGQSASAVLGASAAASGDLGPRAQNAHASTNPPPAVTPEQTWPWVFSQFSETRGGEGGPLFQARVSVHVSGPRAGVVESKAYLDSASALPLVLTSPPQGVRLFLGLTEGRKVARFPQSSVVSSSSLLREMSWRALVSTISRSVSAFHVLPYSRVVWHHGVASRPATCMPPCYPTATAGRPSALRNHGARSLH